MCNGPVTTNIIGVLKTARGRCGYREEWCVRPRGGLTVEVLPTTEGTSPSLPGKFQRRGVVWLASLKAFLLLEVS